MRAVVAETMQVIFRRVLTCPMCHRLRKHSARRDSSATLPWSRQGTRWPPGYLLRYPGATQYPARRGAPPPCPSLTGCPPPHSQWGRGPRPTLLRKPVAHRLRPLGAATPLSRSRRSSRCSSPAAATLPPAPFGRRALPGVTPRARGAAAPAIAAPAAPAAACHTPSTGGP